MNKATITVSAKFSKHFQTYEHGAEVEIFFVNEEDYDSQVKYWQAKVRKLVMEEMRKDELKKEVPK